MQEDTKFDALYKSIEQLKQRLDGEILQSRQNKEKYENEFEALSVQHMQLRIQCRNLGWKQKESEELKRVEDELAFVVIRIQQMEDRIKQMEDRIKQESEAIVSKNKKLDTARAMSELMKEIEEFKRSNPEEFKKWVAFVPKYLDQTTEDGRKKVLSEFNWDTQKKALIKGLPFVLLCGVLGALAGAGTAFAFSGIGFLGAAVLVGLAISFSGRTEGALNAKAAWGMILHTVTLPYMLPIMAAVGAAIGIGIAIYQVLQGVRIAKLSKEMHKARNVSEVSLNELATQKSGLGLFSKDGYSQQEDDYSQQEDDYSQQEDGYSQQEDGYLQAS